MKKTIFFCDVCGKEVPEIKHKLAMQSKCLGEWLKSFELECCVDCKVTLHEQFEQREIEKPSGALFLRALFKKFFNPEY